MSSRVLGLDDVPGRSHLVAGDVADQGTSVPTGFDRGRACVVRSAAIHGPAVASGATRMQAQAEVVQEVQAYPPWRAQARMDSTPSIIGTLPVAKVATA